MGRAPGRLGVLPRNQVFLSTELVRLSPSLIVALYGSLASGPIRNTEKKAIASGAAAAAGSGWVPMPNRKANPRAPWTGRRLPGTRYTHYGLYGTGSLTELS